MLVPELFKFLSTTTHKACSVVMKQIQVQWNFISYLKMLWGLLQGMVGTYYGLENHMSYQSLMTSLAS